MGYRYAIAVKTKSIVSNSMVCSSVSANVLKGVSPYIRAKFITLLKLKEISLEHSGRNLLLHGTRYVVAVLVAGWLLQRVSVAVLIRGEIYRNEDALLASEKALSTRVWVS